MSQGLLTVILNDLRVADESSKRELAECLRPYLAEDPEQLLDAREMAELVGVHPDTLVRWARGGRIWAQKVGREWRFRADRPDMLRSAAGSQVFDPGVPSPRRGPPAGVRPSVAAIRGTKERLS